MTAQFKCPSNRYTITVSSVKPVSWLLMLAFAEKQNEKMPMQKMPETMFSLDHRGEYESGWLVSHGPCWDLFFSFHPGKAEWVCMLFCIRCPQLVNNSHQQPLSHSPTYLTSIQCSDSPLIIQYFSAQMCVSVAPKHTKNNYNMTDAFHNNPLFNLL